MNPSEIRVVNITLLWKEIPVIVKKNRRRLHDIERKSPFYSNYLIIIAYSALMSTMGQGRAHVAYSQFLMLHLIDVFLSPRHE